MSWPTPDGADRAYDRAGNCLDAGCNCSVSEPTLHGPGVDPLAEWYHSWSDQAEAEGWSLFETGGGDHEPVELEACCDAEHYAWVVDPEFHNCDDEGAWRHVITGALAGNELHQAALMCLHRVSPGEFTFITRHTLGGAYA